MIAMSDIIEQHNTDSDKTQHESSIYNPDNKSMPKIDKITLIMWIISIVVFFGMLLYERHYTLATLLFIVFLSAVISRYI
jgi:cell division protein FtsL